MSFKDKLKTLCSNWFVTREEGVLIIADDDYFSLTYNGKDFDSSGIAHGSNLMVVSIEMPYGNYYCEATSETSGVIIPGESEYGENFVLDSRVKFLPVTALLGEPQVTTQQEI